MVMIIMFAAVASAGFIFILIIGKSIERMSNGNQELVKSVFSIKGIVALVFELLPMFVVLFFCVL
jgi:type III secretory pathway component EscU